MVTRSPRALSREPRLEAVSPFPRDEATPPVTNRCLVGCAIRSTEVHANTVLAARSHSLRDAPANAADRAGLLRRAGEQCVGALGRAVVAHLAALMMSAMASTAETCPMALSALSTVDTVALSPLAPRTPAMTPALVAEALSPATTRCPPACCIAVTRASSAAAA